MTCDWSKSSRHFLFFPRWQPFGFLATFSFVRNNWVALSSGAYRPFLKKKKKMVSFIYFFHDFAALTHFPRFASVGVIYLFYFYISPFTFTNDLRRFNDFFLILLGTLLTNCLFFKVGESLPGQCASEGSSKHLSSGGSHAQH